MNAAFLRSLLRGSAAFVVATVAGSILFAQSPPGGKAVRGAPIQPAAPRGEPIRPAAPAGPAVPAVPGSPLAPGPDGGPPKLVAGDPVSKDGYQALGFDKLAGFNYVVPEYTGTNAPPAPDTNQIPSSVKGFDGRKVAVKGFMLPLKVEGGKVTELLLMRDQSMCCFGSVPKINEFVTVKMVGGGTKAVMDQAVTLYGKIKVGEFSENGYLLGIYQLDADRADGPGM